MTHSEEDAMDALAEAAAQRDERTGAGRRRRRGVVHTPPAIARFVARRVADVQGTIVDPACGPGVFLAACIEQMEAPRAAIGVDLDARALDDATTILEPLAARRGWDLSLRRGNTLAAPLVERGPLVIVGNPPWAGRSANAGAGYTDALLEDFRRDADGAPLGERKIGVLSDDYVRFVRWACEQLRRPEGGALALVTNASFLDGPVHRGMRARLVRWFASIEVIDLGGSALVARSGERDENVFGVRPGAAITIARRPAGHDESGPPAAVAHVALRGTTRDKLARLDGALAPARIEASPPQVRFVPAAPRRPEYDRWPALPDLMPFHREGLQTNRDGFCVDPDEARLRERLAAFAAGERRPWPGKASTPSRHYDPELARERLVAALEGEATVVRPVAYRPRDDRFVCVVPPVCHRPRPALLAAVDRSEGSLLTVRKDRGERAWAHFGATRHAVDNCWLSSRSSCRTRAFPTHLADGAPNLDAVAVKSWAGFAIGPSELWRWVLAVLAAPSYRARYDGQLRADYPRIPPPPSPEGMQGALAAADRLIAALEAAEPGKNAAEVLVGHRRLRGEELAEAVAACDIAMSAAERH